MPIFHPLRRRRFTLVWSCLATVLVGLLAGRAVADEPPRCSISPSTPGTLADAPSNCCASVDFACSAPEHVSPAIAAGRMNVVVVVADDQGYCQYSFMAGACSGGARDGETCRSDIDCPSGACTSRDPADGPLRLNDYSCRYRQPPSLRKGLACGGNPDRSGDNGTARSSWPFSASNFPCSETPGAGSPTGPAEPVPLTPHLDRLASEGLLFTRAHTGGNACKPSRATLLYGKHQRHLKELVDESDPPSIAGWLEDTVPEYRTFLIGKSEVLSVLRGGFDLWSDSASPRLARFKCTDPEACAQAVKEEFPKVPYEGRPSNAGSGMGDATDIVFGTGQFSDVGAIATGGTCPGPTCTSRLEHPFFEWLAPKVPHTGSASGARAYGDLYEGVYRKWELHEGRVTHLDLAVGTYVDELERSCVCGLDAGGNPAKQSLWDNTVLIYVADQGAFMPDAKRLPTENTFRSILLVSDPRQRLPESDPRHLDGLVLQDQYANSIDLLRTITSYAGAAYPVNPADAADVTSIPYPYARDLRQYVEGTLNPTTTPVRRVQYGSSAKQGGGVFGVDAGENNERWLLPRPGELGLCTDTETSGILVVGSGATAKTAHVKPCRSANDCSGAPGSCVIGAKRCANDPSKRCSTRSDCVEPTWCVGASGPTPGRCAYDGIHGSFGDVATPTVGDGPNPNPAAPAACFSAADCLPEDVDPCQPLLLKVSTSVTDGGALKAWDLRWDPDETRDLLDPKNGDPAYLGGNTAGLLGSRLDDCLEDYWTLAGPGERWLPPAEWRGPGDASTCPWTAGQ